MLVECHDVFSELGIADLDSARLMEWIHKGRAGEPLTVVSPVCPDYATEKSLDGRIHYTFNGVNGGIGLAAKRLYESLPRIDTLFRVASTATG